MMRIVHTCLRYPPSLGGVEYYVQKLVEGTRNISEGRDVRVLTSRLRTHGPATELPPAQLINDPPYVQRLHYRATPFLSYPRLQALEYYLAHHQPTILHAYSFWYQPADTTARFARRHKIPFIFHPMFYDNEIRKKLSWRLYKSIIGRRTFAAADVVAVISPYEQQLIERAGLPVKRFALLSPGIDVDTFSVPRTRNPFAARGVRGPVLLSVGRLSHNKAYHEVVAQLPLLLTQFPDVQYAIFGEDFGAHAEIQAAARRLGVENHVHLLGAATDEELRAAYQHAAVFVHPSHYEAFGIVLAESQAAGLPVVARNVAATPYVVQHQKTGFLFSTPQELTAHLAILLGNTLRRQEMAQAGQHYVRRMFAQDSMIQRVLSLYAEINGH